MNVLLPCCCLGGSVVLGLRRAGVEGAGRNVRVRSSHSIRVYMTVGRCCRLLSRMETYHRAMRSRVFYGYLAWLNKWVCARTYGMGSKLPWDPAFLVESLSELF